ncbi:type II secretion system protein GspL [Teredinibacter sp. KSP-S5-2]|uniref:type II secretion system protein GspL n=1 Tax=Teredinibacter sp. KSP-S5-2 TaxID=3034506 RepID=UPI002934F70B|nr:type II secretion system protein GspL [Teredinibacter sp. KSP-S5-2]WNO08972.1 type II secretion system protein GspL [Teredinibacter sp. KSP-S5-2]
MANTLFIRSLENGLWQWRFLSESGEWLGEDYSAGDTESLLSSLPEERVTANLMFCGQQVVSCRVPFDEKEKRHIAKLLPYEMEERIIDNVDDLHFAIGDVSGGSASVAYARMETVARVMEEVNSLPCDLYQCLPDYLMLQREAGSITIVYDDNQVFVNQGEGIGFTVDAGFAPVVLGSMESKVKADTKLVLVAEDDERLQQLLTWLPDAWQQEEGGLGIDARFGSLWDAIDTSFPDTSMSLRRGAFARQLPIARWWETWQMPAYIAAAAFVLSLAVSFSQYLGAKSEFNSIREETTRIFLDAVPNGRKGDPERELKSRLKSGDGGGQPTNMMRLLSASAKAVKQVPDITFSSFRYNGDNRELQLDFEAKTFADVEKVRELIGQSSVNAELMRVNPKGGVQQARLKITEAAQ